MKWCNDRKERSGAWRIKVTLMKRHAYSAPYGDLRLVNAGSVGMPYEDAPGAYWVLVRDGEPEHRRTEYDLEAAAERIRPTGWPIAERWLDENLLTVPTARDAAEFFEQQRSQR